MFEEIYCHMHIMPGLQIRKWSRARAYAVGALFKRFNSSWCPAALCRPTAVGVDDFGLHEAHSEVVKNRRFVEVAESRQVVLSY